MIRITWWKQGRGERKFQTQQQRHIRPTIEELETRIVPSATGFRPTDEVGNNVVDSTMGTAGTDLLRLSPAAYKPVANGGDGLNTPSLTSGAPTFVAGPRLVSNIVDNQAAVLFGDPSTDINTVDGNGMTDFGYTFGQFMDHDMDLTPTQSQPWISPRPNRNRRRPHPTPIKTASMVSPSPPIPTSRPIHSDP